MGETFRRSVMLTNKGALGTRFEFIKVPDKPVTAYTMETSLGRMVSNGICSLKTLIKPFFVAWLSRSGHCFYDEDDQMVMGSILLINVLLCFWKER